MSKHEAGQPVGETDAVDEDSARARRHFFLIEDSPISLIFVEEAQGNSRVTGSFGRITVRGVTGTLEIQNQNGDVALAKVSGTVKVSMCVQTRAARSISCLGD